MYRLLSISIVVLALFTQYLYAKPLRFELSMTDYYHSLRTSEENTQLINNIINNHIQISGEYSASRDITRKHIRRHYEKDCGVHNLCLPFLIGRWSKYVATKTAAAKIISYDSQQHKVIFELPAPEKIFHMLLN